MYPNSRGQHAWFRVEPWDNASVQLYKLGEFIGNVPESEWLRICQQSCRDLYREPEELRIGETHWIEGPPNEPGDYWLRFLGGSEIVATVTSIDMSNRVCHFCLSGAQMLCCIESHKRLTPSPEPRHCEMPILQQAADVFKKVPANERRRFSVKAARLATLQESGYDTTASDMVAQISDQPRREDGWVKGPPDITRKGLFAIDTITGGLLFGRCEKSQIAAAIVIDDCNIPLAGITQHHFVPDPPAPQAPEPPKAVERVRYNGFEADAIRGRSSFAAVMDNGHCSVWPIESCEILSAAKPGDEIT
jgi:hypothetical protein